MSRINILYLLGSGRSGTTLLATILNSTPKVISYGELHQFYTYLKKGDKCSCEKDLDKCDVWNDVLLKLNLSKETINAFEFLQNNEEKHQFIPLLLMGKKGSDNYVNSQDILFNALNANNDSWVLDSSKYVGRFLLLNQLKNNKVKGIYVVRDIRGVIHSFNKQVQTQKKPISTIFYYILTNTFAQIVCWLKKDVIKLRYEDLVDSPLNEIKNIYTTLLNLDEINFTLNETFDIPHIIGGNRLKSNKTLKIIKDVEWKQNFSRRSQVLYYILCFPFMLINKYKI